ncbi:uncharacterized protein Bfra_001368 [Botrytis fragariae]|uniref:Uncharacterized protein n=1 Tax=Botrytis fragariae TaxID=1964551 RepID=A0A8H6B0P8_9HELO|nr:uncharacterized protein Bfra_001368 [Botrytis fragariae]KAF5877009.1 hypothetical protein Bfra_001368 [Botrytis fragariae]
MTSVESESFVQRDRSFQDNRNQYIRDTDRRSLSNSPDYSSRTYTAQTYSPPGYTLSGYTSPTNTVFNDVFSHIHDEDLNISEERCRNTTSGQYDATIAQNSITTSSKYNDYLWQGTSYPSLNYSSESIYNSQIDPSLWNCTTMSTGPIAPLPVVTEAQGILNEHQFKQCWDIPSLEAANSVQINEYAGVTFPSCIVGQASIARTASVNSFLSASSDFRTERERASPFFDMTESMTIRSQSPGEESYRSESTSGSPPPSIAEKSSIRARKRRLQERNDPNHVNRRGDTGRRKLDRYFCTRCNAFPKGWKLPEDLRKHNQGHHTEIGFYCASGVDENCAYWSSQESRYIDHLKVEHASSRISQEIVRNYNTINGITLDGSYMCRIPGCEKVYKRAERGRRDKHEERKAAHVFKRGLGRSVDPAHLFPNSHVGCRNDETERHVDIGQCNFAHSGPARESWGVSQSNRQFK